MAADLVTRISSFLNSMNTVETICLIQAVILFVSAVVAIWAIKSNGYLARTRATIDLILSLRNDNAFQKGFDVVRKAIAENKDGRGLSYYSGDSDNKDFVATQSAILNLLNTYEFIAVGVKTGAFDEATLKRLWCQSFVRLWRSCSGFVCENRQTKKMPTLYQEFEVLAEKWSQNQISPIKWKS